MDDLSFILFILACGLLAGFTIGIYYESTYGQAVKDNKMYFASIMRMIPALKIHYTDEWIYSELVKGKKNADSVGKTS
ncbi:MAG: hypothetical protein DRR42_11370 [Gammaproteobacteria bacterium]|nr:MAG: hypothetical protein DRR42_11370 [Gammaproteobacteria bacterium]